MLLICQERWDCMAENPLHIIAEDRSVKAALDWKGIQAQGPSMRIGSAVLLDAGTFVFGGVFFGVDVKGQILDSDFREGVETAMFGGLKVS